MLDKIKDKVKDLIGQGTVTFEEVRDSINDKIEKHKTIMEGRNELTYSVISFSDASFTAAEAARICIGKHADEEYDKRLAHISRVVGVKHESTIAHSNIILLITFGENFLADYAKCSSAMRFLNISLYQSDDDLKYHLLIGGSIRAYKYFLRNVDTDNPFVYAIISTLQDSSEKEFYQDLIVDGIMDANKFSFYPLTGLVSVVDEVTDKKTYAKHQEMVADATDIVHQKRVVGERVDILHTDDPYSIEKVLNGFKFTTKDILDSTSITLVFHDLSRAIATQIIRHRAAISQESQRYVNYGEAKFIDPTTFNQRYDDLSGITIKIDDKEINGTPKEIGQALVYAYNDLIDQGLYKEHARGYLPMNVETKMMMTFAFSDIIHFIFERTKLAAQDEVRAIANELLELLNTHPITKPLLEKYSFDELVEIVETPVYKHKEKQLQDLDDSIDEIVSVKEHD